MENTNYKCTTCNVVYGSRGIRKHLGRIHSGVSLDTATFVIPTTEPVTPQPWHSKKRKKGKHKMEEGGSYKCLKCEYITGTASSISRHMSAKHNEREEEDVNWKYIKPDKKERKKSVSTPGVMCIDVPIVLRIPILIGTCTIAQK